MASNNFAFFKPFCLITAIAAASGAAAQDQRDEGGSAEIVVTAPYEVRREVVGRASGTGAPIEVISLTRRVDYSDLDLTRHADVQQLEQRVNEIAREACDQLSQLYPIAARDGNRDCVTEALRDAMRQVEQVAAQTAR